MIRADFGDKKIDKLVDALAMLWDKKRKKENKKKTWKQFWKEYREDVKRQQAEYKALPFMTKLKMELKKGGKIMFWSAAVILLPVVCIAILDSLGWHDPIEEFLQSIWPLNQ